MKRTVAVIKEGLRGLLITLLVIVGVSAMFAIMLRGTIY